MSGNDGRMKNELVVEDALVEDKRGGEGASAMWFLIMCFILSASVSIFFLL